jgi:hypothetical protein
MLCARRWLLRFVLRPELRRRVRVILWTPMRPNLRFPVWRGSVRIRTLLR